MPQNPSQKTSCLEGVDEEIGEARLLKPFFSHLRQHCYSAGAITNPAKVSSHPTVERGRRYATFQETMLPGREKHYLHHPSGNAETRLYHPFYKHIPPQGPEVFQYLQVSLLPKIFLCHKL
jgi:hypothetical protein